MNEDKFVWKGGVLWRANADVVAGWVDYIAPNQVWYARTAGTIDRPSVRAEFDNKESARDFLMFIANTEDK